VKNGDLLNHLVGLNEYGGRRQDPERLRSLYIDGQLECGCPVKRYIFHLNPLQYLRDLISGAAVEFYFIKR